jgi:hypothetical protein
VHDSGFFLLYLSGVSSELGTNMYGWNYSQARIYPRSYSTVDDITEQKYNLKAWSLLAKTRSSGCLLRVKWKFIIFQEPVIRYT